MASSPYLNADNSFNRGAIMAAAHAEARANVARAAARGVVRRYAGALRCALKIVWGDAQTARYCAERDRELAALSATHAAILLERTAALMIDSDRRMLAEAAAIDARAAALGLKI